MKVIKLYSVEVRRDGERTWSLCYSYLSGRLAKRGARKRRSLWGDETRIRVWVLEREAAK